MAASIGHLRAALAISAELGSVPWQVKTLAILSETHSTIGDTVSADTELKQATLLLAELDSKEAMGLRLRLESTRTALLAEPKFASPGRDRPATPGCIDIPEGR